MKKHYLKRTLMEILALLFFRITQLNRLIFKITKITTILIKMFKYTTSIILNIYFLKQKTISLFIKLIILNLNYYYLCKYNPITHLIIKLSKISYFTTYISLLIKQTSIISIYPYLFIIKIKPHVCYALNVKRIAKKDSTRIIFLFCLFWLSNFLL